MSNSKYVISAAYAYQSCSLPQHRCPKTLHNTEDIGWGRNVPSFNTNPEQGDARRETGREPSTGDRQQDQEWPSGAHSGNPDESLNASLHDEQQAKQVELGFYPLLSNVAARIRLDGADPVIVVFDGLKEMGTYSLSNSMRSSGPKSFENELARVSIEYWALGHLEINVRQKGVVDSLKRIIGMEGNDDWIGFDRDFIGGEYVITVVRPGKDNRETVKIKDS